MASRGSGAEARRPSKGGGVAAQAAVASGSVGQTGEEDGGGRRAAGFVVDRETGDAQSDKQSANSA